MGLFPKLLLVFAGVIFCSIFVLFLIRVFSERQLDDVSPGIPCDAQLMRKADVFYTIPKFDGKSIAEHQEWCKYILSFNKTLALHGVYHTYQEFSFLRNESYLHEGIEAFQDCFHFRPERFKPPQLALLEENRKMISRSMKVDGYFNQIFHKVYHCEDGGRFSHWIIDWF